MWEIQEPNVTLEDIGMEMNHEVDCRGMKCPRPIIEIAKIARRSPPATLMRIIADDLAFESDVRAWCENSGSTLVSLDKEDEYSVAVIRLPAEGRKK